jgi:DNA-directed RNA polymerase specialized sigma24 family protein
VTAAEFDAAFRAERVRHVRMLQARGVNEDVAEDAVQDGWTIAWVNRDRLDADHNFPAYAFVCALHEAYREWRRRLRRESPFEVVQGGRAPVNVDAELEWLEVFDAIATLRPNRQVPILCRLIGLSYKEAAGATDHTRTWMNRGIAEGRAQLRAQVG